MAKPKEHYAQRPIGMPGILYSRLDKLRKIKQDGKKESWADLIRRVLPILEEKMKQ